MPTDPARGLATDHSSSRRSNPQWRSGGPKYSPICQPAFRDARSLVCIVPRWSIEKAFQDLATTLRSEINTLGYPKAALLGFCLALITFNLLSTLKGALRSAHKLTGRSLSTYYLADEIAMTWRGMDVAIPARIGGEHFARKHCRSWRSCFVGSPSIQPSNRFSRTHGPQAPQTKRESGYRGRHVATSRLLQQRPSHDSFKRLGLRPRLMARCALNRIHSDHSLHGRYAPGDHHAHDRFRRGQPVCRRR